MSDNYHGKPVVSYSMGVDLGQVQDYTAIAVAQHTWARWELRQAGRYGVLEMVSLPSIEIMHDIVHLERVPLGTSYPAIVDLVGERFKKLPDDGDTILLADATGVGRPVVELMRQKGLNPHPVTITGGHTVDGSAFGTKIPKRDLVGSVQVLMQNGQLRVADGLREGRALVRELQNFKYRLSTAGNDTYGAWRESDHDDLVLAVAIALWWGRKRVGYVL